MAEFKYSELAEWLISNIESGVFEPCTKIPAETSMEKQFSISRQTVRRAVQELTERGLLYSVQGSGTYVADRNTQDKFIKAGNNSRTVIMVLSDDENYIFPEIAHGASEYLNSKGYMLNVMFTSGDFMIERQRLELILTSQPFGVIYEPASSGFLPYNNELYKEMANTIPTVFMHADFLEAGKVLSLRDRKGGKILTEYLIKMGHTKIGTIMSVDEQTAQARFLGYLDAHYENKIRYSTETQIWRTRAGMNSLFEDNSSSLKKMIHQVTAVVCHDDRVAHSLIGYLRQRGIKVPEDISVVGYDDSLYSRLDTQITSVVHPKYNYGVNLARALLVMAKDPDNFDITKYEINPKLIERESVADLNR